MDPVTIAILASLGKAGFQYFQGQKQKKMSEDLKPSNYVPPAVREAEATARIGANATVAPGYGRFADRVATSTANAVAGAMRGSTNPNVIQQTVMDSDARSKELLKDVEVSNQAWRTQNQDKLNRVLQLKGGYEKQNWDNYNATKSALLGASMQNKYNAVSGLAEGATYAAAIDSLSGGGKPWDMSSIMNPFKGMRKSIPMNGSGAGMSIY